MLFRTAQGTKLYSAVMGDWVAFEADYHDPSLTYGWSVIIKGRAHLLSANADILDAQEAPLRPWIATLKPLYVRVIASEITGRRFKFGPEQDHETIDRLTAARQPASVSLNGWVTTVVAGKQHRHNLWAIDGNRLR